LKKKKKDAHKEIRQGGNACEKRTSAQVHAAGSTEKKNYKKKGKEHAETSI